MVKYLKFHFLRAIESKKLILTVGLLMIIGVAGFAMCEFFYSPVEDPMIGTLSMFNSFTQFFYLILAYVIVSNFSDDVQSGAMTLFRYMGISSVNVVVAKLIYCVLVFLPIADVFILVASAVYGCEDVEYIWKLLLILDLCIVQVILICCTVSLFVKKTSFATIVTYGLFICLNVFNAFACGLTNQADSNSLSTYYVDVISNKASQRPNSWDFIVSCNTEQLFTYTVLVSLSWIVVLLTAALVKAKRDR